MNSVKEQKLYLDNKICKFCGKKFTVDSDIYFDTKFKNSMIFKHKLSKSHFYFSRQLTEDITSASIARFSVKVFSCQSVKDMTSNMNKKSSNRLYINTYKVAYCSCGKSEKIISIYSKNKSHDKEKLLRKLIKKQPHISKTSYFKKI